jgi:uncharacterized protein (DUF1499 family)
MSSVALSLTAVALAIVVLAPALAHFSVVPPLTGFKMWLVSALPAAAAIATALLAIALKRGTMTANGAAIVLALVPFVIVGMLVKTGRAVPRINDIATDLDDPPEFVRAKVPPYPEKFKSRVRSGYKDLAPAFPEGTRTQVFERALANAKELGWEVTSVDSAGGRFEAVSSSWLWNFKDDVVVRVRDDAGRVRVDMRSRSRDGKGDFGANAARIRTFLAKL